MISPSTLSIPNFCKSPPGYSQAHYEYIFLQDAAKPVTELPFPSVTICSPGLNMKAVEEALLEDFDLWLRESGTTDEGSPENQLDEFMEEKYATTLVSENVFGTIKAMISPSPSSDLQNLVACEATRGESDMGSRKKRSPAGEGVHP